MPTPIASSTTTAAATIMTVVRRPAVPCSSLCSALCSAARSCGAGSFSSGGNPSLMTSPSDRHAPAVLLLLEQQLSLAFADPDLRGADGSRQDLDVAQPHLAAAGDGVQRAGIRVLTGQRDGRRLVLVVHRGNVVAGHRPQRLGVPGRARVRRTRAGLARAARPRRAGGRRRRRGRRGGRRDRGRGRAGVTGLRGRGGTEEQQVSDEGENPQYQQQTQQQDGDHPRPPEQMPVGDQASPSPQKRHSPSSSTILMKMLGRSVVPSWASARSMLAVAVLPLTSGSPLAVAVMSYGSSVASRSEVSVPYLLL